MFDDVLTVRRYPTITDHGVSVADFTATPAEFDIPGCDAQPGATDENLDRQEASRIAWSVYAPAGSDVRSTDHAVLNGGPTRYVVSGEPNRWGSGATAVDHVVIYLEAWSG